jgi:hypothetical protein
MADQASVSQAKGTQSQPSAGSMVGNLAEFGNDVATLAELQAQLAVHDAKDCVGRATIPLIVVGAGAALGLASLPVILLGLADLIARGTGFSAGLVQFIVGLVALAGAGVAAYLALKASLRSLESFRRSHEELSRNISWIRTVLVHSGRSIARPRV